MTSAAQTELTAKMKYTGVFNRVQPLLYIGRKIIGVLLLQHLDSCGPEYP